MKDLMQQKTDGDGKEFSIFSTQGLRDAERAVGQCDGVFDDIKGELAKASKQLGARSPSQSSQRLRLSPAERAKWPFLQPRMDTLRRDLKEAKNTLLLILTVATLAHAEKVALK